MFALIRHWFDKKIINRSIISSSQWDEAFLSLPLLAGLTDSEINRLKELVILLIHKKTFEGAKGLTVTLQMALTIAIQACLPILKLGLSGYDGWSSIIVYPAAFSPKRTVVDEYGVTHVETNYLAGESWLNGPIILAWDETEHAGIIDGSNLVIHEFAHKLDMENGVANGYPALHRKMVKNDWVQAFSDGFEILQERCERGQSSDIDCYGATSPAEFFAVLSEVFFEHPHIIDKHYPEIYVQLRQYYRQDTLIRLAN